MINKHIPYLTGTLLGSLTYAVLLYSPLSAEIDQFVHGYYQKLGLCGEKVGVLWKELLILLGVVAILALGVVFQSHLAFWQKAVLGLAILLIIFTWSPVLAIWGIIWSPFLLIAASLWSVLCVMVVDLIFPGRRGHQEMPSAPENQFEDVYTVESGTVSSAEGKEEALEHEAEEETLEHEVEGEELEHEAEGEELEHEVRGEALAGEAEGEDSAFLEEEKERDEGLEIG